jgi:membrane-bound lytic murein transglycosylase D
MKMQRKFFAPIFFAFFLVNTLPAQQLRIQKNHPLSARDTITDNSIVIPEDMERNYDQLLFDWNKQFVPSRNCFKSSDDNIVYPDSVYINRLYALPTLMEMAYNQVTRAYIDMYTGRKRTQVEYMLARGKYFFPIFEQALDKYNIPMELKYLPVIESALSPIALSRAGASGLWQFMAPTGKMYDLEVNSLVDERRDPVKASEAAARYLKDMYRIYGDWNLVIAAYNCGPGNVNKAIRRSGGKRDYWEIYPYLPRETRGYVPAFIAANYVMNYYKYHNLCPLEYSEKDNTDTIHINKSVHFQQIADVLNIPIDKIREMNPQFKNDIIPGEFRNYAVCLPTTRICDFISYQDSIYAYRADEFLVHRKTVNYATSGESDFVTKTVYHSVKRGESLTEVARRYGVTSSELKKWNKLRSNKVKQGRRLAIRTQVRVRNSEPPKENQHQQNSEGQPASEQGTSTFAQLQAKGKLLAKPDESASSANENTNVDAGVEGSNESQNVDAASNPQGNNNAQPQNNRLVVQKDKSKNEVVRKNRRNESENDHSHDMIHHKVVSGETLAKLADEYKVSVNDISKWNKITRKTLRTGQELIIYPSSDFQNSRLALNKTNEKTATQIRHKVKAGENLSKIAELYSVSQDDISKWNSLNSSLVKVGQQLVINQSSKNQDQHLAAKDDKSTDKSVTTPIYHKVKKGETLGKIAELYNVGQEDIKEWNKMNSSVVKVGQELLVNHISESANKQLASNDEVNPLNRINLKNSHRAKPKYYFVKRGDTLMSIAERYANASVHDIKLANNLKSDRLSVGQKLKIPATSSR